jgi:hypothetical protein
MAKLDKFWVVCDPSPNSEMGDIFWDTNLNEFADYCAGTRDFRKRNHTIYANESEAKKDAEARMAKRKTASIQERVASRFNS